MSSPSRAEAELAVSTLLGYLRDSAGVRISAEAEAHTPARVVEMLEEVLSGYGEGAGGARLYAAPAALPVAVTGVPFYSMCEHHLLPFYGHVDVRYLPESGVMGLSAITALVGRFSRRLQLQERMTADIAAGIEAASGAGVVEVVVEAEHLCMAMRGTKIPAGRVRTAVIAGRRASDPDAVRLLDRA